MSKAEKPEPTKLSQEYSWLLGADFEDRLAEDHVANMFFRDDLPPLESGRTAEASREVDPRIKKRLDYLREHAILSPLESDVLGLVMGDFSNAEMAEQLDRSIETVRSAQSRIRKKFRQVPGA